MQINNITPLNKRCIYNYQTPQNNVTTPLISTNFEKVAKLPSTKDYLSFTGGYSLNLAETVKNLDKLAAKDSSVYPKNIREWAGMILESGNRAKETLIDIHKKYYEAMKKCTSLNEVKKKFPEFYDVLSDSQVDFSRGSFGADVKEGLIECFDKDEDLSLQILKLYYGDGFSLNDLKNYTNGKDIFHTMKKLNIPRQNKTYGHVLKFSDPDYNARLTAEMTYKRRLALDAKAQEAGEPVYIPRGSYSKEHCEHISEGLKKYFSQNPERLYEMSERQKEFYRQNPEKSEELSRVLNKAWNIFGADRIKSAMSKFMKSKGIKSFNPESSPVDISKEQSKVLKQFWGSNEWAKKAFSKNMEYAWKKVKEENELCYTINITPEGYKKHFYKWAQKKGIDTSDLNFDMIYYPFNKKRSDVDRSKLSVFTRLFADESPENEPTKIADSYLIAIFSLNRDISKINLKKLPKDFQKLITDLKYTIKDEFFGNGFINVRQVRMVRDLDAQQLQRVYSGIIQECYDKKHPEIAELLPKYLNETYDKIDKGWRPQDMIRLEDFFTD